MRRRREGGRQVADDEDDEDDEVDSEEDDDVEGEVGTEDEVGEIRSATMCQRRTCDLH